MADDKPIKERLLERIAAAPNSVWTASDFADLASRGAIDKTLQRLATTGALRRIDRGLYDKPGYNRLTQQPTPPSPRAVIDAIARRDQIRILVDGMTAANDLGLTNAVPAKIIVHTDARLRPVRLGNLEITFRPTAASKLYWAGRPAMRLVQALHWLRDVNDDEYDLFRKVRSILDDKQHGLLIRADLEEGLTTLPFWMQDLLKPLLAERSDT